MRILSNGIDIVEVKRVEKIHSKFGSKFLNRVLIEEEIDELRAKGKGYYQSLSARVAAKEAVYKALNSYNSQFKPLWKDIRVFNKEGGPPAVKIKNRFEAGFLIILSISHTKNYALANALLVQE